MKAGLDTLLRHPGIWRAGGTPGPGRRGLATGFPELDLGLPEGGWPRGALSELLYEGEGGGELGLVMPALARLSRAGRWTVWVNPPWVPYAPALAQYGLVPARQLVVRPSSPADTWWTLEQALRCGDCGAVLGWPGAAGDRVLRRLQLAAEETGTWGVLFRPTLWSRQSSPAALRLALEPGQEGLRVRLLKCRGGVGHHSLRLARYWPEGLLDAAAGWAHGA